MEKTEGTVSNKCFWDFLDFKTLYFPIFAKWVFAVIAALVVIFGLVGVVFGLVSLVSVGFFSGLALIAGSVIYSAFILVIIRLWFELVVVVFNINDAIQDIRGRIGQ
ncbi:MAG: DUF4282 domain-containing protein [Planctomycetota bacterium]|jgi:hypothetical protein|nr:DUF4282 domain-containing protein [Planctomycetota bacterium]